MHEKPITNSNRPRPRPRLLTYEKELNQLLRAQLDKVEPGLIAVDNGREREVPSGRIDITALDRDGNFVAIELKVGRCPAGALEQVLGYSADLEEETGRLCRAVIIAASFSSRQRAAARRAHDVHLVTYQVEPRLTPEQDNWPSSDQNNG